jgi:hypothetical protein
MPSWRLARQYGSADCSHNLLTVVPLREPRGRALEKGTLIPQPEQSHLRLAQRPVCPWLAQAAPDHGLASSAYASGLALRNEHATAPQRMRPP